MPHKRETQMRGPRISEFCRIWNRRAFQERKLSWLDEKLSYHCPGRGEPTTSRTHRLHNKQGVPHPTRSAIGRRFRSLPTCICWEVMRIFYDPKLTSYILQRVEISWTGIASQVSEGIIYCQHIFCDITTPSQLYSIHVTCNI